jgi:DNA-binding transcriptional regulator WhiA
VSANNPRLADAASEANRQCASQAGRTPDSAGAHRVGDIAGSASERAQRPVLQHRISNPDATLAELGQAMTPAMTKHAYAALLRRALRAGGGGAAQDDEKGGPA